MDLLTKTINQFGLLHGKNTPFFIGYSGGLDSHVLLHLLCTLRQSYPIQIHAVHINHGLSSHADQWAAHCADVCNRLNVELTSCRIFLPNNPDRSPEEIAREERYLAFSKILPDKALLLTAHHQDDQAETVLLQLLRGAGPKGLAAMPAIKVFGKGMHARPLLNVTRADLKSYAETQNLVWIDDESNLNKQFSRNFLRHDIMPILKMHWPSVTKTLARVAENCAESQAVLDQIIKNHLIEVRGSSAHTLSVKKLLQFDLIKQRAIIREWLCELNFPIPTSIKLQQIQRDMLQAREDKSPYFSWNGVELRRYRDDLFAIPTLKKHNLDGAFSWNNMTEKLQLPVGVLNAVKTVGKGLHTDIKNVSVRFRQGGEVMKMPGRNCHHSLKKLFQEWGVLPWERDRIPLIYCGNELAAVVGYEVSEGFQVSNDMEGYSFSFTKNAFIKI